MKLPISYFDAAESEVSDADNRLPITFFLLGGGFIGGLLCGLVMLIGGAPDVERPDPISKFSTPERISHAAQVAATSDAAVGDETADEHEPLGDERERLLAELETLKLKQQVAELQQRLGQLETSPVSAEVQPSAAAPPHQGSPTSVRASTSTGEATLAFWNRMNDVIDREAAMRSAPQGGITATNAGSFLDARVQAAQFAAEALRGLDATGVDRRAIEVAHNVAEWYDEERDVAETGRDLLSQSPQARQGSAGQSYQADEKAHAQAVGAVNAHGERVRQQLSQQYKLAFPALK